jgi:hypothetical protein
MDQMEGGAIGLTFNSMLSIRIRRSNLNTSPKVNPIGYDTLHQIHIFQVRILSTELPSHDCATMDE